MHGFTVNTLSFQFHRIVGKRNDASYYAFFVQVYIKYVGMLKNGKIVQSNASEKPYKFKLGNIFANTLTFILHIELLNINNNAVHCAD
jgi:hypothetical protein